MKTREGFVSNSSTSSFVLLVDNVKPKGYFSLVDMLQVIGGINYDIKAVEGNRMEFVRDSKCQSTLRIEDIKTFDLNAAWRLEHWKERIAEKQNKLAILRKLVEGTPAEMQAYACGSESKDLTPAASKKAIEYEIRVTETLLRGFEKSLCQAETAISLCAPYKDKDYSLVFFSCDQMWGGNAVDMIENSGAIIVAKDQT